MFSPIAAKLREKYDGIFVASEYTDTPARFPAVTIIEISNVVLKKMITTTIENASKIAFEVNCFSNKVGGAKIQARDIIETVDKEFEKLGFARIMMAPTPNIADATIYRITARYEGIVAPEYGLDGITYRVYIN